jgi:hypothetical protein
MKKLASQDVVPNQNLLVVVHRADQGILRFAAKSKASQLVVSHSRATYNTNVHASGLRLRHFPYIHECVVTACREDRLSRMANESIDLSGMATNLGQLDTCFTAEQLDHSVGVSYHKDVLPSLKQSYRQGRDLRLRDDLVIDGLPLLILVRGKECNVSCASGEA